MPLASIARKFLGGGGRRRPAGRPAAGPAGPAGGAGGSSTDAAIGRGVRKLFRRATR